MPNSRIINVFLAIGATTLLASCDYFSVESQLYRQVNGLYGVSANCTYVNPGEDAPLGTNKPTLTVADYYAVDDRSCGLHTIVKDGKGFLLKSERCITNWKKISDSESTHDSAEPFDIRVEAIDSDTVIFKETGKEPVTVYRCDQKK